MKKPLSKTDWASVGASVVLVLLLFSAVTTLMLNEGKILQRGGQKLGKLEYDLAQAKLELKRSELRHLVEPIAWPFRRLAEKKYEWQELWDSCDHRFLTDKKEVISVRCDSEPEISVLIEGPNYPEVLYGNRILTVTIKGYPSESTPITEPAVIETFTITTEMEHYSRKDRELVLEYAREREREAGWPQCISPVKSYKATVGEATFQYLGENQKQ